MSSDQNSTPTFSGEFCHGVDPKGRVTIPASWRKSDADEFYLMVDRSNSFVRAMSPERFRAVAEKIEKDPAVTPKDRTVFLRHFYSRAMNQTADKQGRLLLPENARKQVGLAEEVVLVGAFDTFEVWNKARWEATQQTEAGTFERVAEIAGL